LAAGSSESLLAASSDSHAQPLPNTPSAVACTWSRSHPRRRTPDRAGRQAPTGLPPLPAGASVSHSSEWLACPPPGCAPLSEPRPAACPAVAKARPRHAGQRRLGGHNFIQVIDIRLVMLVVVDLHGLRVNIRFQRVVRVRQLRQSKRRIGRRNSRGGRATVASSNSALRVSMGYLLSESITGGHASACQRPLAGVCSPEISPAAPRSADRRWRQSPPWRRAAAKRQPPRWSAPASPRRRTPRTPRSSP